MITPWPVSTSPCSRRPSLETRRSRSRKPNTFTSQSRAAGPSAYAIIGMTAGYSLISSLRWAVFAKDSAQDPAALPDRHVVRERGLEHRHQVVRAPGRGLDRRQVTVDHVLRAPLAQSPKRLDLLLLAARVDLHDLDLAAVCARVLVHAHDHAASRLHTLLEAKRAVGDPLHGPAGLDAPDRAAALVDLGHDRLRLLLDAVGEVLDVVRASERVGDLGHGGLA